jgi:hypothetical protein
VVRIEKKKRMACVIEEIGCMVKVLSRNTSTVCGGKFTCLSSDVG